MQSEGAGIVDGNPTGQSVCNATDGAASGQFPTPFVGMKLWEYDPNRRIYRRDETGRAIGPPIWREHWVEVEIIGETRVSWLIGHVFMKTWPNMEKRAVKLPKREFPGEYLTSIEEIGRKEFVSDRHVLAERIRRCHDYETLKAIEAALDAWDRQQAKGIGR